MKKVAALILALCMIICAATTALAEDGKSFANPGTYVSTQEGINGDITVTAEFSESAITDIHTEHMETDAIGAVAIEELTKQVLDSQSVAVDIMTGATISSTAFIAALKDVAEQAGANDAVFQATESVAAPAQDIELNVDVAIVGAGGAGLAAAVAAHDAGASVVIFEKEAYIGGATALSGGNHAAAGTAQQKALGIEDTPEIFAEDMWERGGKLGDFELVTMYTNATASSIEWLASLGLEWSDDVGSNPQHNMPRAHHPAGERTNGQAIIDVLNKSLDDRGLEVLTSTPVTGILTENGVVTGVTATSPDGSNYTVHAKTVVLAAGGFSANVEMMHEYNNAIPLNAEGAGHPGATGEVMKMAEAIGAKLVEMPYMEIHVMSNAPAWGFNNAILVNLDGARFVDENADAADLLAAISEQPEAAAFAVYDSKAFENSGDRLQEKLDEGTVLSADTLEELAEKLGVNAEGLVESVNAYNGQAEVPLDAAPYYASAIAISMNYTNGGVAFNTELQVLNQEDQPIEGLYAAGEITGGMNGTTRTFANGVGEALTLGRIAGENAANFALAE